MALNVQWRWGLPQQGNPDTVAQGNRDYFTSGVGAIMEGIQRRAEHRREAEKLAQAQNNWEDQFAAQQEQRRIQNAIQERQFAEQKRMNDMNIATQQYNMEKARRQEEWLQKFYDQFFGDDDEYQELKRLRAQFAGDSPDSALIMMGMDPSLR